MSIRYSTNWMGPISMRWFRDRGLTCKQPPRYSEILQKWVNREEITERWMGGRIDVYGSDCQTEIGLPIMSAQSWGEFSQWLNQYSSETEKTLDELVQEFYNNTNKRIKWYEP
jgi:hypothetical protein